MKLLWIALPPIIVSIILYLHLSTFDTRFFDSHDDASKLIGYISYLMISGAMNWKTFEYYYIHNATREDLSNSYQALDSSLRTIDSILNSLRSWNDLSDTAFIFNSAPRTSSLSFLVPIPKQCIFRNDIVSNVNVTFITYRHHDKFDNKYILYFHGGGFTVGGVSHIGVACNIALMTQTQIIYVWYTLAPIKSLPFQINQGFDVYRSLIKTRNVLSKDIIFMGDSAGAAISILLSNKISKMSDIAQPNGLVLLSPWFDLEMKHDSYKINDYNDIVLPLDWLNRSAYLAVKYDQKKFKSDECNPIYIDFDYKTMSNNIYIIVSKHELFYGESMEIANKIKHQFDIGNKHNDIDQHYNLILDVENHYFHDWMLFIGGYHEANITMTKISQIITKFLEIN